MEVIVLEENGSVLVQYVERRLKEYKRWGRRQLTSVEIALSC